MISTDRWVISWPLPATQWVQLWAAVQWNMKLPCWLHLQFCKNLLICIFVLSAQFSTMRQGCTQWLQNRRKITIKRIETLELLWNNLAPSASPLLALGSDLSNKGSGAALPSDTKSEQLLLDCANRLISFSIVGCCSRAKMKIWHEDSKFSLP